LNARDGGHPSGATRLAALVGQPVRHSLSPALHNAAFAASDADWVFVALEVAQADGAAAFAGARALGIDGLSVTMPLKAIAAASVDRLSAVAARLGAVNTVAREGATLVGHNTDGVGFLDALAVDCGWEPAGCRCVVFGAGGAARAVVLALADAGAGEVVVVNRTAARAVSAAGLAGAVGRVGEIGDVAEADLIVNATSIGMVGRPSDGGEAITAAVLASMAGPGQLVVDLVYHPVETPLLVGAAQRGAATAGGVGMLVHQAAHAFTLWTGLPAPVGVMTDAVRAALAARSGASTGGAG
jgi:shikimate dehydrogenase